MPAVARQAPPQARPALAIVLAPTNLRKTTRIAAVVGCILTAINQADVIAHGDLTALVAAKIVLNFCVPFVVSNLGVLAATRNAGV